MSPDRFLVVPLRAPALAEFVGVPVEKKVAPHLRYAYYPNVRLFSDSVAAVSSLRLLLLLHLRHLILVQGLPSSLLCPDYLV